MFEVWSESEYKYTAYMRVDENGNMLHELTKVCGLRLSRTSELFYIKGTDEVHVTSGQEEGVMNVFTFKFIEIDDHDHE